MGTPLSSNQMSAALASMAESVSVVFLDSRINLREEDKAQFAARLPFPQSFKRTVTFGNVQKCEEYIRQAKNDKILLCVGEDDGKVIVPRIHALPQVYVISLYCWRVKEHTKWAENYEKVDVHSPHEDRISEITRNQKLHGKIEEPISFRRFTSITRDDEHSSIELAGEFQFSQLLADVLLKMESTQAERQEFISVCRKQYDGSVSDLRTIEEFERTYSPEQAVHWYTKQTFLYLLLNKALRVHDVDLLILFQFFIKDIYQQLRKLQQEQSSTPVHVYRGQLMSNEETGRLLSIEGQVISMNSFLSTSRNRDLGLLYLGTAPSPNDGLQRVLFDMFLDPRFSDKKPFADITAISNFPEEGETLLMLGSIFRLENIRLEDGIWIMQLSQCDDIDPESRTLLHFRTREIHDESPLFTLANLLFAFLKSDAAERCVLRYLKQLPENHPDVFWCYYSLGNILENVAKDNESLRMYKKALAILEQTHSYDHRSLSLLYSSMGKVYTNICDYEQALMYQTRALSVFERMGTEGECLAQCLECTGDILSKGGKTYEEALRTYQRVLTIREKIYHPNHPYIATTHMNVGGVYGRLGRFDLALKHLDRCLEIQQKSLPPNHPAIGATYVHMGIVYGSKRDHSQALNLFEKALDIYRKSSFPPEHPSIVQTLAIVDMIKRAQR